MKRSAWLSLLLLAGCQFFMRPTYPAAKYFAGSALLPLAQFIEADDADALSKRLTYAPSYLRREPPPYGMSLIMYALMNRRKACLTVLLNQGFDPNQSTQLGPNPATQIQVQPVGAAAGSDDPDLLKLLLKHGGDPNSRYDSEPALFTAIGSDRFGNMRLLLDKGADINATNRDGNTLVVALADHAEYSQVIDLIKRGADINKPNNDGSTLAFSVQMREFTPGDETYRLQQEVKKMLTARGIQFPVPHPGIAFQERVRQENLQRRAWEQTPEGASWLRRMGAATQSDAPGAANEAMQLRQQAEPAFQAWRKTQPNWVPTTNDGEFALYNSPMARDLEPYVPPQPLSPEEVERALRERH